MDLSKLPVTFSKEFMDVYNQMSESILDVEGIAPHQLDIPNMAQMYMSKHTADMSIDDNANVSESKAFGNYLSEIAKSWYKLIGYYELYNILVKEVGSGRAADLMMSVWYGDLYFHDSTSIMVPYCWAYSTSFILFEGSRWGQLHSTPAKRRRSFLDQVKEVTIELAQQAGGAIAIGDFFVNYSYFVKKENMDLSKEEDRKAVENDFQSLVHTLNKKLRPSFQSPFTNLSIFDKPNLEHLFADVCYPDGSKPDFDLIEKVQHIFCDWFKCGDPRTGLPYRFPVVTLNIRIDENQKIINQESFEYFSKINLEKGCFNIYISSGNKIASCCRLVNDLDLAGVDSFGNGGVSLGSHRVVTLNLARIGRLSRKSEDVLFKLLQKNLDDAKMLLNAHRKLLKANIAAGFLPFFNYGIMHEARMFSTFGLNGIYECVNEMGFTMLSEEGKALAHKILKFIRVYAQEASKETRNPFNIEQVPAESLAVKFAAKDRLLYGMDYPLYANQFIPLWVDCDISERVKLDGEFSRALTGGGISHLNIGEKLTHTSQMERLIKYAIECGCEHFAVNYNFCRCKNGHVTVAGQVLTCPVCGDQVIDYLTRIIGYFTPVSAWTKHRKKEHKQRVFKANGELSKLTNSDMVQKSL
ncbi:MAG: Oxygen-sensitive ribonucleoside-triphosphate reductase-like protein [candidate division TM6 bacterium GW2011_GWF2_36_6]|nr:MAG: Oxygen-sensitive ribonucleoside-triphosphate reductase-like protein [candidate division TM6 bacterium GW2011_GWF2_36_6]